MPDPNFSRINGTPYSWHSCAHFFMGLPYKGVLATNFKQSREVKIVHAAQQDGTPLGTTAGIYKVESFSFRMLRSSALALKTDLTVLGLGSYGDAQFNYMLQLFEPTLEIPPQLPATTLITGCRITGVEDKQELGVEELVTEFTCSAQLIVETVGGVPLKLWSTVRSLLP